jgi:hypothetical protein
MGIRKHQLAAIRAGRGILKRKSRPNSFAEEWAEHKREERELDEKRFKRLAVLDKEQTVNPES